MRLVVEDEDEHLGQALSMLPSKFSSVNPGWRGWLTPGIETQRRAREGERITYERIGPPPSARNVTPVPPARC